MRFLQGDIRLESRDKDLLGKREKTGCCVLQLAHRLRQASFHRHTQTPFVKGYATNTHYCQILSLPLKVKSPGNNANTRILRLVLACLSIRKERERRLRWVLGWVKGG